MSQSHGKHNDRHELLRGEIDEVLVSLGGSIQKTVMWHMNIRGVFSNPKRVDIAVFYKNLDELLGPLSDEILNMTWRNLQRKYTIKGNNAESSASSAAANTTSLDRIQRWLSGSEGEK